MVMNGEQVSILKEVGVAHFKVPSQNLHERMRKPQKSWSRWPATWLRFKLDTSRIQV